MDDELHAEIQKVVHGVDFNDEDEGLIDFHKHTNRKVSLIGLTLHPEKSYLKASADAKVTFTHGTSTLVARGCCRVARGCRK